MKKNYQLKKFFLVSVVMLSIFLLVTGCSTSIHNNNPNTEKLSISDDFDEGALLSSLRNTSLKASVDRGWVRDAIIKDN